MSAAHTSTTKFLSVRLYSLIFAIAFIGTSVFVLRRGRVIIPALLGNAKANPAAIQIRNGIWYWLEHSKTGDRLMRTGPSGVQVVATADVINGYGVENDKLVWIERQGNHWTVMAGSVGSWSRHSLWTGADQPFGVAISAGRVYWLQLIPAPVTNGDPFPTLSASFELRSVSADGGEIADLARLWESEDGRVLGVHDGSVYIAAYRHTPPGNLCIYRVGPPGTTPVRIIGESGNPPAILTQEGVVYWVAPSLEARDAYCVRRLDRQGHIVSLSDWLPMGGVLYETKHGVVYGDRQSRPELWFAGPRDVFPTSLTVPTGYSPLAAGENDVLLMREETSIANPTLYRMPLP